MKSSVTGQTCGGRLTQTLVGAVGRRSPPGPVVEERLALLAVVAGGVVFTVTHQPSSIVPRALAGVAVTLTPGSREAHLSHLDQVAANAHTPSLKLNSLFSLLSSLFSLPMRFFRSAAPSKGFLKPPEGAQPPASAGRDLLSSHLWLWSQVSVGSELLEKLTVGRKRGLGSCSELLKLHRLGLTALSQCAAGLIL